jgi:ElaA protein
MTEPWAPHIAWREFDELTPRNLYELLKLRMDVFVVEQNCAFAEIDGHDPGAVHGLVHVDGRLVGTARLFGPPADGPARIGRIATHPDYRGKGIGAAIMRSGMAEISRRWAGTPVVLGAQAHLQAFYAGFGFETTSDTYLEDGVPHVEMRLAKVE